MTDLCQEKPYISEWNYRSLSERGTALLDWLHKLASEWLVLELQPSDICSITPGEVRFLMSGPGARLDFLLQQSEVAGAHRL
jgi:hypothetical protein